MIELVGRVSPTGPRKARPDDRLRRNPPLCRRERRITLLLIRPTRWRTPVHAAHIVAERDDKAMPLGRSSRDFLNLFFRHRLFVSQSGILAGNFFKSLLMIGFFPIQVKRDDVHFLANSIETPGQDQLAS